MNDLKEMQQNMMDELKGLKEKNEDITNSLSKLESLSNLLVNFFIIKVTLFYLINILSL